MQDNSNFSPGKNNVFAELGFNNSEELMLRAELVQNISKIISKRKLTQVEAAKYLGIKQPDLNALLNGRLNKYSLESLLKFVSILGNDIEITIKPKRMFNPGHLTLAIG